MGELELIDRIRSGWRASAAIGPSPRVRAAASRGVVLGIGDDCAILRPPRGHEVLVTTDFTLEGRHFRRDWHSPESVGHRALARGLSDLAAMGARPLAAFLSLALPTDMLAKRAGRAWVEHFFDGLRDLAGRVGAPLAGGDTSESPNDMVLADIVLVGSAPANRALRRSGGSAGDALYVTGALGGAAAELAAMALLNEKQRGGPSKKTGTIRASDSATEHPQLFPEPRLAVGQALLRRRLATAAIDLSDGLSTDLAHLCRESGVGAVIEAGKLPIHPLAKAHSTTEQALGFALNGGEDYELLFAAPPSVRIPHTLVDVPITCIGKLLRGKGISLIEQNGRSRPLKPGGWEHFAVRH
jgi:thiamine-monophosphate kinase